MNSCKVYSPSFFISEDIIFEIFLFPKPRNLGQIHTSTFLYSVVLNCLYPENDIIWKINKNGY